MKIAGYKITTQELIPPIGNLFTHCAALSWVYVETNEGNKRIDLDLGEVHGISEEDAYSQMKDKLDTWLSEQR